MSQREHCCGDQNAYERELVPPFGSSVEQRLCHFCGLEVLEEDSPIQAMTKNGWAHYTCWYGDVVPARLRGSGTCRKPE